MSVWETRSGEKATRIYDFSFNTSSHERGNGGKWHLWEQKRRWETKEGGLRETDGFLISWDVELLHPVMGCNKHKHPHSSLPSYLVNSLEFKEKKIN